jgi:signal transduction histidine kinase
VIWLNRKLGRRFALGTAAGLLLSSLVFLVLFLQMYRGNLEDERTKAVGQVTRLLQTSLENAMLKRDLEGLRTIVARLGEQPDIAGVFITNPAGEIRFSDRPERLGRVYRADDEGLEPTTRFLAEDAGREVLRSRVPVLNRAACLECHGPASQKPVNGILYVDYDASPLRLHARNTTLILMGSGAVIVLLNLAGGWWFIRRFVLAPVEQLTLATEGLGRGDLASRVNLAGQDEMAQLGRHFDAMAERLQLSVQELRDSGAFLQALVDAIPDGIRIIDHDYRVRLCNETYRRLARVDGARALALPCYAASFQRDEPCPPTLITCPLHEIRMRDEPVRTLHRFTRDDGSDFEVEVYAAPLRIREKGADVRLVVESIRDLGAQVRWSHEQKLSELGKLAAGVAHEIHNPLASVRFALHAIRGTLPATEVESVAGPLAIVDDEIDRCINITERLLKLAVAPPAQPELVDLDVAVGETLSLLRWEAESLRIDLQIDVAKGLRVVANDGEIRMIVLNLAQNAFHAMPKGGALKVTTRLDGAKILIELEDTGVGIPTEDLHRIFEPFFSRRADGAAGTGLGLSICRSLVKAFHGELTVESRVGVGSKFTVSLPDAAASPLLSP